MPRLIPRHRAGQGTARPPAAPVLCTPIPQPPQLPAPRNPIFVSASTQSWAHCGDPKRLSHSRLGGGHTNMESPGRPAHSLLARLEVPVLQGQGQPGVSSAANFGLLGITQLPALAGKLHKSELSPEAHALGSCVVSGCPPPHEAGGQLPRGPQPKYHPALYPLGFLGGGVTR